MLYPNIAAERARHGMSMDELAEKSSEPWFVERIYSKLVNKSKRGIAK